jgi:ADP-L-glycero-D-manno-heptose 6-epimerase
MSKTYLITGAAGFIGARFAESCNARGISVIAVDEKHLFAQRPEHQAIGFDTIIDRDELFAWLAGPSAPTAPALTIDAVIHMGACANTMETDVQFLKRVNVEYSQKLWNYCADKRIPFVYASSAATYGDGAMGYDDDETQIQHLKPLNEYGRSKQIFDEWVLVQERAGRAPRSWAGFKFFNVYGFGERHKQNMASVILHAYDQIQKTGGVRLFKSHRAGIQDGEQKRDFVAVEDVIEVLHFAVEKPIRRGIFNLGTGHAQTFLDLVRAVFSALGKPEHISFVDTPIEIRDKYQYFTEARMERLRAQGYLRPFMNLDEGAKQYIERLQKLH